ncbi:MAG: TIGR02391 family protein [Gammaproteobacteria bacterium]
MTLGEYDFVAVKSGFGSGYVGEGSRGFSYVLQLLYAHRIEMEEVEVSKDVLNRLDDSALTHGDVEVIRSSHPIRPQRWVDYIFEDDWERRHEGRMWYRFPPVIPLSLVDSRIADLAMDFWKNPDDALLKGYRRLEDIVRERTGIDEHGTKLFSRAFSGSASPLYWTTGDANEHAGRCNVFIGTYMSFRNRRAHREVGPNENEDLFEFLLLNSLFRLESEAVERDLPNTKPAV